MHLPKKTYNPAILAVFGTGVIILIAFVGFYLAGGFSQGCKINMPCTMNMGNYKQPILPVKAKNVSDSTAIIDGKSAPVVAVPVSATIENSATTK